jgi:hypothetical protein
MQIIRTVCDPCFERNELIDSVGPTVTLAVGKQVVNLDLCEQCTKELTTRTFDFMSVGRRPDGVPRKRRTRAEIEAGVPLPAPAGRERPGKWDAQRQEDGTYVCPSAKCDKAFSGPSGIGRHVATQHPEVTAA